GAARRLTRYAAAPVYEATAVLLISEGQKPTGQDYNGILMSERLATTYAELLKGTPVLSEVGKRLRLGEELALAEAVTVQPVRDTQLLRLRVRHRDRELAARLANTICQVFIEQNARRQATRLAGIMESLTREMSALQAATTAAETEVEKLRSRAPSSSADLARLEALLAQHRANYASLLQTCDQLRLAEASSVDTVSVIEPATEPTSPVEPRTGLNTAAAGLFAAMVAAGVAFLVECLDDTIQTSEEVRRAARLPTLAAVGHFGNPQRAAEPIMVARPGSPAAEGYRMLRTALRSRAAGPSRGGRLLLISSPLPREGKTTTLANLGVALAQSGRRVVLVDADLRCPGLHEVFRLPQEPGLTTLLLAQNGQLAEQVLQETTVAGLAVLTAGPIPANPAEVLDRPETDLLLERLRSLADYVLVDSPPVLTASDAAILAHSADGVLLVAEAGRTRAEALAHAVSTLRPVADRIVGVVLNRAGARAGIVYHPARRRGHKLAHKSAGARAAPKEAVARASGEQRRKSR
ncbi:MAG: polysaccharide biosynthesis tyrosine autokinase, partial [Anaerolineae bacterium]|nr:polysaccharide biosynthesis tyrosine autokinase [Anaerolineae bacterium]